jgi:predicted DNA-binding transcriptional regulator YafY
MNEHPLIEAADDLYRVEAALRRRIAEARRLHRRRAHLLRRLAEVVAQQAASEEGIARAILAALDTEPVAVEDEIGRAIAGEIAVTFDYEDREGNVTPRTVSPYAVYQGGGAELVRAYDHDRDALRSFRLDRIAGTVEAAAGDYVYPVD